MNAGSFVIDGSRVGAPPRPRRPFASSTALLAAMLPGLRSASVSAAPPAPPTSIAAVDHFLDDGEAIDVEIGLPLGAQAIPGSDKETPSVTYVVGRSVEPNGVFWEQARIPSPVNAESTVTITIADCQSGAPYWFEVYAENDAGERSAAVRTTAPARAVLQPVDGRRLGLLGGLVLVCGGIIASILLARMGRKPRIRRIAGLDAVDEAVGRATEMGRPCVFIAGLQDMNEIETLAGITVLSRVAGRAAEYDATILMPTSRSLVMTAARETTQAAYLAAGRPDAYQEDRIYYVTDEQFGFVAHVAGLVERERPAACFYMGQFYAESLMLAETGNTVGAIQIAGTAQPAQLPFFVAACDYTLIGEEFFAASAYLSGDPDQLGSLRGQDLGKLLATALIIFGCLLETLGQTGGPVSNLGRTAADFLKTKLLQSG